MTRSASLLFSFTMVACAASAPGEPNPAPTPDLTFRTDESRVIRGSVQLEAAPAPGASVVLLLYGDTDESATVEQRGFAVLLADHRAPDADVFTFEARVPERALRLAISIDANGDGDLGEGDVAGFLTDEANAHFTAETATIVRATGDLDVGTIVAAPVRCRARAGAACAADSDCRPVLCWDQASGYAPPTASCDAVTRVCRQTGCPAGQRAVTGACL